jgi:alpha-glucosidase
LFYEFDDPSLYSNDVQFLVGSSVLVTSVLQPNESTTTGIFPSADGTTWTDWWTHQKVDTSKSDNVTLDLPLGEIGVHVRSGSVLLLHADPGYTLTETREGGYEVLVVLDGKGYAEGTAKIDDGVSLPGTRRARFHICLHSSLLDGVRGFVIISINVRVLIPPWRELTALSVGDQTCLNFTATNFSCLNSSPTGSYNLQQPLTKITILGVTSQPSGASLNGQDVSGVEYKSETEEVVLTGLNGDLNQAWELKWWWSGRRAVHTRYLAGEREIRSGRFIYSACRAERRRGM